MIQPKILSTPQVNKLFVQINFRSKMDELKDLITEQNDPEQVFELLDILGQGSYGSVSKALHKQTGVLYAIKILPATSGVEISAIKKQIGILKECNNDHIVRYFGSYYKDDHLWIVMEYCIAGSVTDIMQITKKKFNQNEIASILESVLMGIEYIHHKKKIHRDIKAANILLDQKGNAKLADFGVSASSMNTNARFRTHIGSPYWMSPQILNYHEYNYKTDIWSLGITAIQMAEGQVPNSHIKPFMAVFMIKSNPVQSLKNKELWSNQFNDFVQKCLQTNPTNRPEAKHLLEHQFIKKYSRGQRLLSELVLNSIQQIQQFRMNQSRNSSFLQIIFDQKREQKKTLVAKNQYQQEQQNNQEQLESSMVIRKSLNENNSCAGSLIVYDNSIIEYNEETENSSKQNDPLTSYIKGLKKQENLQIQCVEMMIQALNKYDEQLRQAFYNTFNQFKNKALNDIKSINEIKDKNPNIILSVNYNCKVVTCQNIKQFLSQLFPEEMQKKQNSLSLLLNSRMKTQNQTTPHSKVTQIKYLMSTENKPTTDVLKKSQETVQYRQQIKSFLIPNNSVHQNQHLFGKKSHPCIFNEGSLLSSIKPHKFEASVIKIPHNSSRMMIKRADQNTQATQSQVKQFTNDPQVLEYLLENKYLKSEASIVQSRSNLAASPTFPNYKTNKILIQQKSREKSKQKSKSKNKVSKNIKNKKLKNKFHHWPQC